MLKQKLTNNLLISFKIFLVSLLALANLQLVFAVVPAPPAVPSAPPAAPLDASQAGDASSAANEAAAAAKAELAATSEPGSTATVAQQDAAIAKANDTAAAAAKAETDYQAALAQQTAADSATAAQKSAADARAGFSTFDVSKYLTDQIQSQEQYDLVGTQAQTYLKSTNPVASFILQIINLITLIAASLSFLAVIIGAFLMMSAAGNATQIDKGKDIVTRALVGLVITLSSYFIVSFVQNLFFEAAPK